MNVTSVAVAAGIAIATLSGCEKKPASEPAPAVSADREASETEAAVNGTEGDPDDIPVPAPVDRAHGSAALLAEAEHVLASMTSSSYSHRSYVQGTTYDVDCSGFVDYLLAQTNRSALAELRTATVQRPLAKHFVQFLASAPQKASWQRLMRVGDLEPGDIVACDKPVELTSTNTGHVMIVSGTPEPHGDSTWAIPVIDSSAATHGKRDSRRLAHTTGVGQGVMVLENDANGAPIAYYWSDRRSSPRYATTIALGRVL